MKSNGKGKYTDKYERHIFLMFKPLWKINDYLKQKQ